MITLFFCAKVFTDLVFPYVQIIFLNCTQHTDVLKIYKTLKKKSMTCHIDVAEVWEHSSQKPLQGELLYLVSDRKFKLCILKFTITKR